jgi:hypothetical protein
LGLAVVLSAFSAQAQGYPPLSTEIRPDHPLFLFDGPALDGAATNRADALIRAWVRLPERFKPYAVLQVHAVDGDTRMTQDALVALLSELEEAVVPVALTLSTGNARSLFSIADAKALVDTFPGIRGVRVAGLSFRRYESIAGDPTYANPPTVRWLEDLIELAASYGRFTWIELDEVNWLRAMANASTASLHTALQAHRDYVIPAVPQRGDHIVPQTSAVFGLWLEGAAANWGIAADGRFYHESGYRSPGAFAQTPPQGSAPHSLYRAMVLNGAMTGACAYAFAPPVDLWHGANRAAWEEAIAPVLDDLLERRCIAERAFVEDKAKVAYQLVTAQTSPDFHLNLRDVDGVLDAGLFMHGAYGMERPGQIAELIPNSGRHYWVPILSPHAPDAVRAKFAAVVRPGQAASAEAWTALLDQHYRPDASGSAFVARVGRQIYILNTRENLREVQPFRIPALPSPVRAIRAEHTEAGVRLNWPVREGDLAYTVLKRTLPDTRYLEAARDLDAWDWLDTNVAPDETVAYTVRALTSAREVYEGAVDYGQYLVLSTVESRIGEEVVVAPNTQAISAPFPLSAGPPGVQSWWPNVSTLAEGRRETAADIAARIEAWDYAVQREDLDAVMDLYDMGYRDPQGWRFQYATRAYQWFFERYDFCKVTRQIRDWDFSEYGTTGQIKVKLYARVSGVAVTDPTGLLADQRAHFPRHHAGEHALTFANRDGAWRIVTTDPAFPNFLDILSFSAGPYDDLRPGPDE